MFDHSSTRTSLRWPVLGVMLAIAVTTTMDATGLSAFSALPLFPLFACFWYLQRMSSAEVGFTWGRRRTYGLAVLYPVAAMSIVALIAALAGAIDLSHTNWKKVAINFALVTVSTILVAIVTEEGFFRGWLWASLHRADLQRTGVLVWSSVAFSLWHISAVTLKTGFEPPRAQIPVFILNAFVIGVVWGLLRSSSGSVIVSSVSHGLWNGMAYVLFGFGTKVGALGIKSIGIFGPEVGILGLAVNAIFAALLWRGLMNADTRPGSPG